MESYVVFQVGRVGLSLVWTGSPLVSKVSLPSLS